jgi:hypothetical protein
VEYYAGRKKIEPVAMDIIRSASFEELREIVFIGSTVLKGQHA